MAVNDIWQLTVKGNISESTHIHTLHFKELAAQVSGTPLITAWSGAPQTAYRLCFATHMNPVQSIKAQKVCGSVPLPGPDEVVPALAAQAGTRAGGAAENMPSFMACLVTEKGALAGRRYSGRFFLGGLLETDCSMNTLSTAYVALVQAYVDALKAAFVTPAAPDYKLFAFSNLLADGDPNHTKRNPNPPPERIADPVTAVPCQQAGSEVINLVVSNRPTTMRSRKLGHGN